MRKRKPIYLFFLILVVLITLFSCKEKPVAGPLNINYDYKNYYLNWDEIKNANYYVLDINGMLYESTTNEYSFRDAEKGLYKVKIKAVFAKTESVYSNTISFVVSEYIKLLVYSDGDALYWDHIDNADYEVSYLSNLSIKTESIYRNKFTIPEFLKEGINTITLRAYVDNKLLSEQEITLDYNIVRIFKNSPYILRVYNADDIYINGKKAYGISIRPDNIRFSSNLIYNYSGEIFISVFGDENILKRVLVLPEPFELKSYYIQPYKGVSVKYLFSFKNYEIVEISGLDYGKDYYIEALNTLVINKSFIDTFKNNNEQLKKIELKVTLKSGDFTQELYLEIDLN